MSVGTQRSAKTISTQTETRFLRDSLPFPLCLPPSSSFSSPPHALSSRVSLSPHSTLSSFTLLLLPWPPASLPSRPLSPPLPPFLL